MPVELAERVIDEAKDLGAEWVSFTGGEPFLLPGQLKHLIGYASGKGLLKEAVTNCFWATSPQEAVSTLRPLVESGLDVLNISVDDFHQEHIPFMNVRHCYEAAKSLGLKVVFMIAVSKNSDITADSIVELLDDKRIQVLGRGRVGKPSALAIETAFTPVGRGEGLPRDEWCIEHSSTRGACKQVLSDIGVRPNGDVLPCCGPLSLIDDAVLGNVQRETLGTILERASLDPRFTEIREHGFTESSGHVNRCHLCYDEFEKRKEDPSGSQ